MVEMNNTPSLPQAVRPRSFSWVVTSCAGLAIAALLGVCFWSELAQTVEGLISADESAAVVASNGLPVDGPAVSVARAKDQETESQDAAKVVSELIFKDWNYTQTTSSPFNFGDLGGSDSSNPLFSFDFNNPGNSLSALLGGAGGTTPFGLMNSSSAMSPAVTTTTTTGGGSTTVVSPTASTGSSTIDPTVTVPLSSGSSINLTISITFNFGALGLGLEGFSHRHAGLNGITITITIQTVSPTT